MVSTADSPSECDTCGTDLNTPESVAANRCAECRLACPANHQLFSDGKEGTSA